MYPMQEVSSLSPSQTGAWDSPLQLTLELMSIKSQGCFQELEDDSVVKILAALPKDLSRFPESTWLLVTISMGSPALFWPPWASTHMLTDTCAGIHEIPCPLLASMGSTHMVHRHMCRQNTQTHFLKVECFLFFFF